jgi:hypothetical protein
MMPGCGVMVLQAADTDTAAPGDGDGDATADVPPPPLNSYLSPPNPSPSPLPPVSPGKGPLLLSASPAGGGGQVHVHEYEAGSAVAAVDASQYDKDKMAVVAMRASFDRCFSFIVIGLNGAQSSDCGLHFLVDCCELWTNSVKSRKHGEHLVCINLNIFLVTHMYFWNLLWDWKAWLAYFINILNTEIFNVKTPCLGGLALTLAWHLLKV